MNLIKFERDTPEDEMLKKLKGKAFFAVTVTPNPEGGFLYEWMAKTMAPEFILMGIELLKRAVLQSHTTHP